MTIDNLLGVLPPKTPVRICLMQGRINDNFVCGTTGMHNTQKIRDELRVRKALQNKVDTIYPLWHAQELYIECSS